METKWSLVRKVCRVLPAAVARRIIDVAYNGAGRYTVDICLPGRGPNDAAGLAWTPCFLNGLDDASVALFLLEVP